MGGAYSMHGSDKKLIHVVRKLEWKRLRRRPRYSWESNIKMNFKYIGCDDIHSFIHSLICGGAEQRWVAGSFGHK